MSNQSSVEWLYQEFERIDKEFHVGSHEYNYAKNLALKISKAMHREEIKEAYWNGSDGIETKTDILGIAEQYYNETFNTHENNNRI